MTIIHPPGEQTAYPPHPTSTAERLLELEHLTTPLAAGELAVVGPQSKEEATADRSHEVFRLSRDSETYEVHIESNLTLEAYEQITPPEQMDQLRRYAETMQGKSVVFVNATMEGGGVAMLRPTLIHLLRQLGVDARWYVMEKLQNPQYPEDKPYKFTKQMHNITQRRAGDDRIDDVGTDRHRRWSEENESVLTSQGAIQQADVIVVDDPQPARLIRPFKAINPTAKVVWRNHVDNDNELMADPATPQGELWQYWRDECGIGEVDAAVFHPDIKHKFVPYDIAERTYLAPATVDEFDDLNRTLGEQERQTGLGFINHEIATKNEQLLAEGRSEDVIKQIDPNRRKITLIARFDESKGMEKAMELGVQTRRKMLAAGVAKSDLPEIVIVGNGSIDDPSGPAMYEKMLQLRRELYPDEKDDIIIMRLKHNYQAMNALMTYSDVGVQTSDAEGCETRITDWIGHSVPVVVANNGGMPLQVQEGISGHILASEQTDHGLGEGSDWLSQLMLDDDSYATMRRTTMAAYHEFNARQYSTVANAIRWLHICGRVLNNQPAHKHWQTNELDLAA